MAIYNTEDFLKEAIDSIINQTIGFKNVELVLVDDGSTDNSKEICLEYKNKFPENIQYIYQENQGQATARNNGMKASRGKYLNFLDSDDKLELNALETVYDFFEKHFDEVDVVSIPIRFFDRQAGEHILNYKYEKTEVADLLKKPDYIQLSASASFIKKKAIKDYIFDTDLVVSEDAVFVNKILLEKKKMGVISDTSYYYRKRFLTDSTVDLSVKSKNYFLQRSQLFFKELFDYSKEKYGEIFDFIKYTVMYDLQWIFNFNGIEKILDDEDLRVLKGYLHELLGEIDDEIILKQRYPDNNLKYHILIFKHGGVETEVLESDNNVKKLVNGRVIDELYYHVFYIDAFEIHKNRLSILGFLKSYFIYPEIKIQAVQCREDDFIRYWTEYVNRSKAMFFKFKYLTSPGKLLRKSLMNGSDIDDADLRYLLNIKSEVDFNDFIINLEDDSDSILENINEDFDYDTIENEFSKREYIDEETYFKTKEMLLNKFLTENGEVYDSQKIEYPLREKKYLDFNCIPYYNFEINIDLKRHKNTITKIRVIYGDIIRYLNVRTLNYVKLTNESFYSRKEDYLIKFDNNAFTIRDYNVPELLDLEEENIRHFVLKDDSFFDEIIRFRKHYYYSFFEFNNRRIWLFMDRFDVADDNAEHLFKYALTQDDGIEKYFILSEDSKDFERLKKIGNVVAAGSEEHKLLACHAEKIISSQADDIILNPFYLYEKYYNGLFSAKIYFLQHGVIKEDISSWLHKYDKYLYLVLTSAQKEYDSFFDDKTQYNYSHSVVKLLGLPRHDYREKLADRKEIVIMPSWRRSLENMSDEQFMNSDFYKTFNRLLNDEKLIDYLDKKGYRMIFKPHHNLNDYTDLFDKNPSVEFEDTPSYNDIFNHSSLVVTDFSSVVFDFAYIKKPVIYYHAVEDYHFNIEESYFDYETMGFGEITRKHDEIVDLIIEYVESECKMKDEYKKRVDEFFKFRDKNNCRRVYNFILSN